jgi:hypothetical protein
VPSCTPDVAAGASGSAGVPWPAFPQGARPHVCWLMQKLHQRISIVLVAVLGAAVLVCTLARELRTNYELDRASTAAHAQVADDVSRLSATEIRGDWDVPRDQATAQSRLRELLKQADRAGLHISIAGARHGMGGQPSHLAASA